MKIRAIRVRDAGHFTDGVALEGLSGKLDVLAAPNEAGKSTLFRALEAVFYEKHTASNARIKAITPADGGSPFVEADFEADGGLWRIAKQFDKGRRAVLTVLQGDNSGREFRGGDAEEKLAVLAGLHDGKPGRLGFLWVGQGNALQPVPPDEKRGEAAALQGIIEREVAHLTGGGAVRRLRGAVADDLGALMTDKSKKPRANGPWDQAIKNRDRAASALAAATAARDASVQRREAIAALKARGGELGGPECKAERASGLAAAAAAFESAIAAERRFKDAQHRADALEAAREKTEGSVAALEKALADYAALDASNAEAAPRLEVAAADLASATTRNALALFSKMPPLVPAP